MSFVERWTTKPAEDHPYFIERGLVRDVCRFTDAIPKFQISASSFATEKEWEMAFVTRETPQPEFGIGDDTRHGVKERDWFNGPPYSIRLTAYFKDENQILTSTIGIREKNWNGNVQICCADPDRRPYGLIWHDQTILDSEDGTRDLVRTALSPYPINKYDEIDVQGEWEKIKKLSLDPNSILDNSKEEAKRALKLKYEPVINPLRQMIERNLEDLARATKGWQYGSWGTIFRPIWEHSGLPEGVLAEWIIGRKGTCGLGGLGRGEWQSIVRPHPREGSELFVKTDIVEEYYRIFLKGSADVLQFSCGRDMTVGITETELEAILKNEKVHGPDSSVSRHVFGSPGSLQFVYF